jgi:hypothetical protein
MMELRFLLFYEMIFRFNPELELVVIGLEILQVQVWA